MDSSADTYRFRPIGRVHSPYKEMGDAPIQPAYSGEKGEIEIFPEFADGLKDIEGFSHIWVIFVFHRSGDYELLTTPYLDEEKRGVFACRAPRRPNPIGQSLVRLVSRRGNALEIAGLDMLDGTPVLDIKPYVGDFDDAGSVRIGWLGGGRVKRAHGKRGAEGRPPSMPAGDRAFVGDIDGSGNAPALKPRTALLPPRSSPT